MYGQGRKRGSIAESRGKLVIRFWWRSPEDRNAEYRWSVSTHEADTASNRQKLEHRLEIINSKIAANAFYPCTEFPDTKIAAYCGCAACSVLEPLSNAHRAPTTLGELFAFFTVSEADRACGEGRIIEASTWNTKKKGITALGKGFTWKDPKDHSVYEISALTDSYIRELSPEWVKQWLHMFQHREELSNKDKPPCSTSYLRNLHSIITQAVRFGQLKRWWRTHPLLEYKGALIEATKMERNRLRNRALTQPLSIVERDKIIGWYFNHWNACPENKYKGREKLRRFFQYHYVVIGFNTGLRSPSEMTALQWRSIDYNRRMIGVVASREASGSVEQQIIRPYTKTIKHREVPINDVCLGSLRALEEHRQEEDWLFWNPRAASNNPLLNANGWAPLTGEKRIRHTFEQCMNALGIASLRNQGQYRMRHTFTTLALDNTEMSDDKVAALIGDSVTTMRAHYAGHCKNRWRGEDDVNQLNALNALSKARLEVVK